MKWFKAFFLPLMLAAALHTVPAEAYTSPNVPHIQSVGGRSGVTVNTPYAVVTAAIGGAGIASGSTTIPYTNNYSLVQGDTIQGACIPAGTTIQSIVYGTSVTMSGSGATCADASTVVLNYYHNWVQSRIAHWNMTGYTISDLQFCYLNTTGQTIELPPATTNPINLSMEMEYPAGTFTNLATFNQVTLATLQPNEKLCTDPIATEIPPGAKYYEWNTVSAPVPNTYQSLPLFRIANIQVGDTAIVGNGTLPSYGSAYTYVSSGTFGAVDIQGVVSGKPISILSIGDSKVGVYGGGPLINTTLTTAGVAGQCTLQLNTVFGLFVGQGVSNVGGTALSISSSTIPGNARILSIAPGPNFIGGSVTLQPNSCLTGPLAANTSIRWGAISYDQLGSVGYIEAGFSPFASIVSLARSGDSKTNWATPNGRAARGQVFGDHFTDCVDSMTGNDVPGSNLAAIQALDVALWTAMQARGCRVWTETITPRALSSLGEDPTSPITITAGGSGYTANFLATVPGGTLSTSLPNVTSTPTTLNCVVSGGAVTSCTVQNIGYYSSAPPITSISITGGAGTGATVTLQAYTGFLDTTSQYSQNASYQPMQAPTAIGNNTTTSIPVSSTSGIVATMYCQSTGNKLPPNDTINNISGGNIIMTLAPTVAIVSGDVITCQGLAQQINDWVRTTPAPLYNFIDSADQLSSGRNTGIFCPKCAEQSGDHAGNGGFIKMMNFIQGIVASGAFATY